MARRDSQGIEIGIGDRLHLYDQETDYGTGTVVPGKGKAQMVVMDPGCNLEGKHNLRDLAVKNIQMIIIGKKPQEPIAPVEEFLFTQEDIDNLNYLLSRGITGSIKRTTAQFTITITIAKQ